MSHFVRSCAVMMIAALMGLSSCVVEDTDDALATEELIDSTRAALSINRGLLANNGLVNQPMRGAFFFPGNWIWGPPGGGVVGFYGRRFDPTDGNAYAYTRHPYDQRHLGWSESATNRTFAVDSMIRAGVNTIVMSYWGPPGTDNWQYWAPMQSAPQAQEELFDAVLGKNITIMPSIEDSAGTFCAGGNSPQFILADHLPSGAAWSGNQVLAWIEDIIQRFVLRTDKPQWKNHFTRMYDRDGVPRYIINLKGVASTQSGATPEQFALGLLALETKVYQDLGVRIGFTLDPIDAHRSYYGHECITIRPTTYVLTPEVDGPRLAQFPSVVAIQYYRSEIERTHSGSDQNALMIAYKRDRLRRWATAGLPVIADLTTGYDGHLILSDAIYVYGNNDAWRNDQSQLRSGKLVGLTLTAWNGFTEGWTGMPTLETGRDGTDRNAMYRWLQQMFWSDPRYCNHVHFVNGYPTYYVYGQICEKYYNLGGSRESPLGAPISSEEAGCAGARRNRFEAGVIVWPDAREVHGAIGAMYRNMGYECSWLGRPITDEKPTSVWCAGGRFNGFEHGYIDWCPDGRLWASAR